MANWCDVNLIVLGSRAEVAKFGRKASKSPSSIFSPDMLEGEARDLLAERMKKLEDAVYGKRYLFQARNDDGREHFTELSRQFKTLYFVLTYDDSGSGHIGSYRIHNGRSRAHLVPPKHVDLVMTLFGVDFDADYDEDKWSREIESRQGVFGGTEIWALRATLARIRERSAKVGIEPTMEC